MSVNFNIKDKILIIELVDTYNVSALGEVVDFAESDRYKKLEVEHVIIDCAPLKQIEDGGSELFLLRKNKQLKNFVFSGLKMPMLTIMNILSQEWFNEEIINFSTKENALNFINKTS